MSKKRRRLKKTVKQKIRIFLITLIVTITGLSYSLIADADNEKNKDYPAYQNTVDIDSQSYEKISLSVIAEEDILPEDTKISVNEVTDTESDDYKNIQSKLEKDAEDNNVQLAGTLIYDLSFKDKDDNPVEPVNDNKIHVYADYETSATPLTENHNEEIALKYISNDDSYTVTDPSDDDPVTINTDDNNAVTDISMDVHGSTYYALVWNQKPEITLHAVDEAGNELIPSATTEISEETDVNTLAANAEGYALTSVTADNTNITEVKADKGKLYFNNGQDWTEASDTNVFFTYAPVQVTKDTTDVPVPEEPAVQEEETVTQPETKQLTKTTKDKKYTVTVTYGDDAGLPEGTDLSLKTINTDDEKYADAKKAVASNKNVDASTLGMEALDITLKDSSGNKVEPDTKSNVQVSISINDLPDNINSVDIHHITEEDTSNTVIKGIKRIGRIFNKDISVNNDKASTVAENVNVINNTANAEFNVNSFSTFTITWTKGKSTDTDPDNTRIGSVEVKYVDENGLEKDIATDFNEDDIAKLSQRNGGIVRISDWAKDIKPDTKTDSSGNTVTTATYAFDHAAIGSRTGITITGIKVESSTETRKEVKDWNESTGYTYEDVTVTIYRLYYTTDNTVSADSNWVLYKDPTSENAVNSAKIYLIYKNADDAANYVTFHFVDIYGNRVAADDPQKLTITNNASYTVGGNGGYSPSGSGLDSHWTKTTLTKPAGDGTLGDNIFWIQFNKDSSTNAWTTTYRNVQNGASYTYNGLMDEFWYIYKDVYGVTIHHVDESGKAIAEDTYKYYTASSGGTLTADDEKKTVDGYTYKDAHVNAYNGTAFTSANYSYANSVWNTTVNGTEGSVTTDKNPVNEVWLVYSKSTITQNLTIHYRYSKGDGTYSDAYYDDNINNKTATLAVSSDRTTQLIEDESGYVETIKNGQVKRAAAAGESGAQLLNYSSSHLASEEGPTVSSVSIGTDGQFIYHTHMSGTADPDENVQDPTSWTLSEPTGSQKGRSLAVIRNEETNALTIRDSQNGDIALNLSNDAATSDTGDTSVGTSYTASYHGENITDEYAVTPVLQTTTINGQTYNVTSYTIEVEESFKSNNANIYQVYTDRSQSGNDIWIEDDMKYSGLFRTNVSDNLNSILRNRNTKNISFEWHEIETTGDIPSKITDETNSEYPVVTRKQTGNHWNIAYNANEATWLDIEAEEGEDTWTASSKHAFYVKLTYTPEGKSTPQVLYTKPVTVNYYGRLENGSFETTPDNKASGSFDNSVYKKVGVWQTTGLDTNSGHHYDIEIVNGKNHKSLINDYNWKQNSKETGNTTDTNGASWAENQDKFAELNAEAAGALYQDVITHPNETLSYGLSHRARGMKEENNSTTRLFDTMYLVIMPTKLAMTSGKNNTELTEQGDINTPGTLEYFIQQHGGYSNTLATEPEDKITYYDADLGILIRKISSDRNGWHSINVTNGYSAKGGLTRFFFVAGPTIAHRDNNRAKDKTEGNFLDNVYFSQFMPTPDGFSLKVKKTFTGLSTAQVSSMASGKSENPFTITITNTYKGTNNEDLTNAALDNAKLQFTVSSTGALTATAVDKNNNDLITDNDNNSSDVTINNDGTITMTWTFYNLELPDNALDQNFNYTVTETNYNVTGYNTAVTNSYTIKRNGSTGSPRTGTTAAIKQKDEVTFNINNNYRTDHIIVRKTFSGITPTTVDEMKNGTEKDGKTYSPYELVIKKGTGDSAPSKTLKLTGTQDDGVTVSESKSDTGSSTFTWTIEGWGADTYTLTENNIDSPDSNKLQQVKFTVGNGSAEEVTPGSNTATKDGIVLTTSSNITYSNETGPSYITSGEKIDGKSLVIASYSAQPHDAEGKASGSQVTRYFIWTRNAMESRERENILAQANTKFGLTENANKMTADNTMFFNGTEVSSATVPDGDEKYVVADGEVTFTNGSDETTKWQKVYTAAITVRPDVTVENVYDPLVKIVKVDSSNNDTKLSGAKFKLYKIDNNTPNYFTSRDGEGNISWSTNSSNAYEFETNSDGVVNIGLLPKEKNTSNQYVSTTYYLVESVAPSGYNKLTKPMSFTVNADGTVTLDTTIVNPEGNATVTKRNDGTVDNRPADITFPDPYYQIQVKNTPGVLLPITGGIGVWPFIFTGFALIMFASYLLWRRRRSKLVEEKLMDEIRRGGDRG